MDKKYIIKNCPMYFAAHCYGHTGGIICQDCTSCLMKQVVGKLKNPNNCRYSGYPIVFTKDILRLFEIEECE